MNRTRSIVTALAALFVVFVAAALPAAAQTDITSGRIVGQAVDQEGQPLPGASIEAKSKQTGLHLTAVTDPRGLYRIIAVPVGTYDVTANLSGFQIRTRTGIVVTVGSAVTVDFRLQLTTVAREVTVTAEAPVIETTQTESTNTVDTNAIKSLPVSGRNFTDFVLLTPNVQRDSSRGNLALGGQRGIATMVTIDGVDSTNAFFGGIAGGAEGRSPLQVSQESVREFQVVQAGASAEFGKSSGGFINVLTKSGSNDFHGSLLGYYRPSSWQAKLAPATAGSDYTDPRDTKKNNLGGSLGGPLLKDELFFFASYERQRQNATIPINYLQTVKPAEDVLVAKYPGYPTSGSAFTQTQDADTFFGRLDLQATGSQRVTLRSNYTKYEGQSGTYSTNPTYADEHNGIEAMKNLTNVLQWNGMFGTNLINDLNLQYVKEDTPRENLPAGAGLPEIQITGGATLGGVYFLPIVATQKRYTLYDSVTYMLGNHVIKAGGDYNYTAMNQVFKGNWRGVFIFRASGSGTTAQTAFQNFQNGKWDEYREFLGLSGKTADEAGQYDQPQKDYSLFLQDQWYITPKLTATLGVRWENELNPSAPILDVNKLRNPNSGIVTPDAKIPELTNEWSPRLSLAYSPDAKTVVRFSAGRYYSRFPAILTSQLYQSNGVAGSSLTLTGRGATGPQPGDPGWGANWNPTAIQQLGNLPPGAKLPAPGVFSIDSNFKNAHTDQVTLGGERDFFGVSVGLEAQYSKGYDLERTNEINLTPSTNPTVDCPNLDPASGVACYGLKGKTNRPNPSYSTIKVYSSDARSEFWSVTMKFRKNFANGLRFFGSVTRATDKDNDSNERDYSGLSLEDLSNPDLNWGFSNRDIKWRLLANVSYDVRIVSWLDGSVGALFNYQTGRPYTATVGQDLNLDGSTVDRPTVDGVHFDRNSYRYPDFYTLDLRFALATTIGPGRFSLIGEVYNLTNTANRGTTNTTYGKGPAPAANFGVLNQVYSGLGYGYTSRAVQAAVRYDF